MNRSCFNRSILSPTALFLALLLNFTSEHAHSFYDFQNNRLPQESFIKTPTPERFSVCFAGSCKATKTATLSVAEWEQVRRIFVGIHSAKEERQGIQRAIALFETIVGRKVGTNEDKGGNARDLTSRPGYHFNCIDEAHNTTSYLTIMQSKQLLQFHRVLPMQIRHGFIINNHNTAAIEDNQGIRYAVDSWFHDNGRAPEIVILSQWMKGWKP